MLPISPSRMFFRLGLFASLVLLTASAYADEPARVRENFDFGWRFYKGDVPGAAQPAFDDAAWRKLDLPHDWSIEGPFDQNAPAGGAGANLPTGVGWYRKHFLVPAALRDQKISITFDGVYMNSDVYLNGHLLGHWPYGYTTFQYDLTPYLNYGDQPNVVSVRVDDSLQPASRWYAGAGIYRNVWITATGPLHVAQWGVYVTTPTVSTDSAKVWVRTEIQNETSAAQTVTVVNQILDDQGAVLASAEIPVPVPAQGNQYAAQTIDLPQPKLWSPDSPHLYRLRTLVKNSGAPAAAPLDDVDTTFGVRSIYFDVDRGFLLNGEPVKMLGMCLHGDAGAVGVAVPDGVLERRLRILKDMGCNALRMSHNPPSPEMLDLCDRLGFLVMDEAFDEWLAHKVPQGYGKYFTDWSQKDLTTMLRRDRNHPSIVLWSVGNEIPEQTSPRGPDLLRPLVETCHTEDPTRPVTSAMDKIHTDQGDDPPAFVNLLDIAGYNYVDRWGSRRVTYFADDRTTYPQRKMVGTEDTGIGGPRGVYTFSARPAGTPERASYTSAMIRPEQLWAFNSVHDYVIGYFTWTGIDYLGEARWPGKGSSSGALDMCGFPKDGYYFYQSQWTSQPVLHLFPHWNWTGHEGEVIPVVAYTNCDVVELFLNGKSYGAKAVEYPRQGAAGGWNTYASPQISPTTADLHLTWDVPYAPGTLRAVGYKNGQVALVTEVRTAGTPAALQLSVDHDTLPADARAVAHVTVRVVDDQGNTVPTADNLVSFDLQGPAQLIGLDNGNVTSHEDYKATQRAAYNGLALAILQSTNQPGAIRLRASAPGLKDAVVTLNTTPPANVKTPIFAVAD
jgi:beta-galactosidase